MPMGQLWPPQGCPGAVPVPPCPRGRGSARWTCGCPPHGMGNGRTINFHRTFFQEKAGVWSVPSRLAHRHLLPVSPPALRAPPGPRPPVPHARGSSMGLDEPSRTPGPPCRAHQSCRRAALPRGSPSMTNRGNPRTWQLGIYRCHSVDMWVSGRRGLQGAQHHRRPHRAGRGMWGCRGAGVGVPAQRVRPPRCFKTLARPFHAQSGQKASMGNSPCAGVGQQDGGAVPCAGPVTPSSPPDPQMGQSSAAGLQPRGPLRHRLLRGPEKRHLQASRSGQSAEILP